MTSWKMRKLVGPTDVVVDDDDGDVVDDDDVVVDVFECNLFSK